MPVLAIKTEKRCKLCKHPNRPDIDALLEKRSNREQDAHGNNINEAYVLKTLAEWGVENPTPDNLKIHWGKHCQVVSATEAEEAAKELSELNKEMLAALDESDGSIDADLRAVFKIGIARIKGRVLRGEDSGVTLDHALKASAELTKRSHNEAQRELLGALGAGLALALGPAREPKQIEGAEVIEGEAVET